MLSLSLQRPECKIAPIFRAIAIRTILDLKRLDGVAKELAAAASFDAGERLFEHFGGQRVYVPEKMWPGSRFWEALGRTRPRRYRRSAGENISTCRPVPRRDAG